MSQRPGYSHNKNHRRAEAKAEARAEARSQALAQPQTPRRPDPRPQAPSAARRARATHETGGRALTRRQFAFAVLVMAVVLGLGGLAFASWATAAHPGEQVAGNVGWAADPPGLQTRLAKAGLPALNTEGEALHIHQHLDIYIHGQPTVVPADIGIDTTAGILSPIHTHDTSGVIHVESPTVQTFYLGQLFQVWDVTLTSQCIGTYCADANDQLRIWVNGTQFNGNAATLALAAHQEIVIAYGTPAEMPSPVPSTYAWTNGL